MCGVASKLLHEGRIIEIVVEHSANLVLFTRW